MGRDVTKFKNEPLLVKNWRGERVFLYKLCGLFFFFPLNFVETPLQVFPSCFSGDKKIKQMQLGHSAPAVFHHQALKTQAVF